MFKILSFAATFLCHFLLIDLSLSTHSPLCPATKFNWMVTEVDETTAAWDSFSSFLEIRGIWLFGTKNYKRHSYPPAIPALDPFSPTQHEDFVHRQDRTARRLQMYRPP